jgi:hypothetical protein
VRWSPQIIDVIQTSQDKKLGVTIEEASESRMGQHVPYSLDKMLIIITYNISEFSTETCLLSGHCYMILHIMIAASARTKHQ